MENAVKALLIAAAVLIAILLISMVMGVFNTGAEQVDNADLSDYEVQQFNDKFLQYVGEGLSGSKVNAMLKTVHNHNMTEEDETRKVTVSGSASVGENPTGAAPKVGTGVRYNVTCTYEGAYIKSLTISEI